MKGVRMKDRHKQFVAVNEMMHDDERQTGYTRPYGITRRSFLKVSFAWAALFSLKDAVLPDSVKAVDEPVPEEPANLDEPTPWQEGDPEPEEVKVPATEPEQTSNEAPPSQPMDDDRGEQPNSNHVWVYGYWWWGDGKYVWVPGYWVIPPKTEYVYIAGYWTYRDGAWVYVRGGWGMPNTTTVVVYANPRPVLTVFVITAPIRIVRRHRRWRHHRSRRYRHRPHRSRHPSLRPKGPTRGPAKGPSRGPSKRPFKGPSKRPSKGPSRGTRR